MRLLLFLCLIAFIGDSLCDKRDRDETKELIKLNEDAPGLVKSVAAAAPRKQRLRAVIEHIRAAEVNGTGCEKMNCTKSQTCVSDSTNGRAVCINKKNLARLMRARGKLRKVADQVVANKNSSEASKELLDRAKQLKEQVQKYEQKREKKQQQRLRGIMSQAAAPKDTASDAPSASGAVMNDAATPTIQDHGGCRQKDLDGMGQKLLDLFKQQQEEMNAAGKHSKHKKEKRNSTKKQLHDFDECMCQATVGWQFQQLDADSDGQLGGQDLDAFRRRSTSLDGSCVAAFFHACDHNADAGLTEKEWCCCFADVLPPCLTALNAVPSLIVQGQPSIIPGSFVPQCDDDGFYKPTQCDSTSGHCWCVDHNGRELNGTRTDSGTPDC